MPWASMALCSTSTRALKWPLLMSMSAWADFMSAPSYLQGPPLSWQIWSVRLSFRAAGFTSLKWLPMRGSLTRRFTKSSIRRVIPGFSPSAWYRPAGAAAVPMLVVCANAGWASRPPRARAMAMRVLESVMEKISLESDLGRQVIARLAAVVGDAGHDATQVHIGQRQRHVLVGGPGNEDVFPVVLAQCGAQPGGGAQRLQVVGLETVFGAHGQVLVDEVRNREFGLQAAAVLAGGGRAKAQQAVLVGIGVAQRAVDEQALCKQQLGGADVHIRPAGLGAQEIQHRTDGAGTRLFVLQAHSDLRHERIGVQHSIARHLDLDADHIHLDVLPRRDTKRRNAVQCNGWRCIKVLPGQRQLHPVMQAQRHTVAVQAVVLRCRTRDVARKPHPCTLR
eukprot:Opistho-2@68543